MLFLVTGTHTGSIPVRVSLWDSEPDLGDWPEIVEASLIPHGDGGLWPWGETPVVEFPLPAESYRVRWNSRAMDEGAADAGVEFGDPSPDSYELMLWPAPVAPERIIRQDSIQAACWHPRASPKADAKGGTCGAREGPGWRSLSVANRGFLLVRLRGVR